MRNKSALVILSLLALAGTTARAAEGTPAAVAAPAPAPVPVAAPAPAAAAPPAESVSAASAPEAGKQKKWIVGASFLPMAMGKYKFSDTLSTTTTLDAYLAYGIGLYGSYEVLPGLLVGFAPQLIFNVQMKPNDAAYALPMKELDLMARVAYAIRPVETLSLYAEALPGYSDIMAIDSTTPSRGFVVALGVGAAVDMTDRFFMSVGGGYQIGFQSQKEGVHTWQLRTEYVRIALGGGYRF